MALVERDKPFSRARRIAFHRASCVGVGVRPQVLVALLNDVVFGNGIDGAASSIRTGSRAVRRRRWDLLM